MRTFHKTVAQYFITNVETMGGTRSCTISREDWTGSNLEGEQFTHHVCRYHDLERERDFVVVWENATFNLDGLEALIQERLTNPQT